MVIVILKYLVLLLLVLIGMILFIPVVYYFEGNKKEKYFIGCRISWLWRIFTLVVRKEENQEVNSCIIIFGFNIPIRHFGKKKEKAGTDVKKQNKTKKMKNRDYIQFFSLLHQSFLMKMVLFARRVLKHVLPRKFLIHLTCGCEDPADTGILTGFFVMLLPYIPRRDMILINPVFDKEILQGEISIKGRIILAVIVYYALQFYFFSGIRSVIRKIRKN